MRLQPSRQLPVNVRREPRSENNGEEGNAKQNGQEARCHWQVFYARVFFVWSSRSHIHVLARRRRPRGVTPVRLPDSRSKPLQSVATSLWQLRSNHARSNTSPHGDQDCRKQALLAR